MYYEAKVEQLSAINPNPVLCAAKDGTIIYSNKAGEPLLNEWDVEVGEKLPSSIADLVQRVISQNSPEKIQVKVGQSVYLVTFHPSSEVEGVNIYGFDTSNMGEFEENPQKLEMSHKNIKYVDSERRWLYDVLDSLPVMICILANDHHVVFANRSFQKKYGEPGSLHCYEYCFGSTKPCEFCESYKVLETGKSNNKEVTNSDGSVTEVYNIPFTDVDGSPMILKMKIDITERKRAEKKLFESEEKYRNIVETANEGIIITDNEAVITYVNKKMTDMLGYTVEEGIGRSVWGFISEDHIPFVKLHLDKRRQGISESYELKLISKDGSHVWTFLNAKPLFDKEEMYVGAMSMFTDITKRKEAEEIIKNTDIARKKEIHHRIKNNLQVISSLLDLQSEKFRNRQNIKDSEVLDAFRESQDRVTSMAIIHEELHKGGKIDTLNFSQYIEKLADNLLSTYRLGNNEINLITDLEQNVFFEMDIAVPLGIIINELISNSLKHAFPDRNDGKILIKLRREEGSNSSFILMVSDNGVGFPDEFNIEKLDRLGLQLVTSLVNQLDGELKLKRNNETAFIIKFTVTEEKRSGIIAAIN